MQGIILLGAWISTANITKVQVSSCHAIRVGQEDILSFQWWCMMKKAWMSVHKKCNRNLVFLLFIFKVEMIEIRRKWDEECKRSRLKTMYDVYKASVLNVRWRDREFRQMQTLDFQCIVFHVTQTRDLTQDTINPDQDPFVVHNQTYSFDFHHVKLSKKNLFCRLVFVKTVLLWLQHKKVQV